MSSHADIAKDEIVAIKAGNIITRAEIEQATDMAGDMALQVDDDFYLAPRSADEVEEMSVFINHSCDPNVGFRGQVVYVALRDISAGEELCHDYALDCHCGSPLCRGKVSGEDWKIPDAATLRGLFFLLHQQQDTARVAL